MPRSWTNVARPHLKPTNKSYRVVETYIKVKGEDKYLYRAVDSTGQTIDFLLAAKRDAAAAKRFFRKVIHGPIHIAGIRASGWSGFRPRFLRIDSPLSSILSAPEPP